MTSTCFCDGFTEHGLPQEAFEWYLDLRRYGSVPHAGFGMGIERGGRLDLWRGARPGDHSIPPNALSIDAVTKRPSNARHVRAGSRTAPRLGFGASFSLLVIPQRVESERVKQMFMTAGDV